MHAHASQGLRRAAITKAIHWNVACVSVLAAGLVIVASAASATPGHVTIKTPGSPLGLTVGFGSIWVSTHRGGYVYRINPRTNRTIAINVGDSLCYPPTIGGGAVWVGDCEDVGVSYKIDPATNRVVAQRKGDEPAFGAGSLWTLATDSKHILRIDPKSGVVLARIDPKIDLTNNGIPAGSRFGSFWVTSDNAVSRIDPHTNKVTAVVPLPGAMPSGDVKGGYLYGTLATFTSGDLWVTNPAGLYKIDPASNTAQLIRIKISPLSQAGDIAVFSANNSIWMRTSDSSVARIDPASGKILANYPASGGGGGIAVGFGSLWASSFGNDTVWREPIQQ